LRKSINCPLRPGFRRSELLHRQYRRIQVLREVMPDFPSLYATAFFFRFASAA
jgi:hypothetical protein